MDTETRSYGYRDRERKRERERKRGRYVLGRTGKRTGTHTHTRNRDRDRGTPTAALAGYLGERTMSGSDSRSYHWRKIGKRKFLERAAECFRIVQESLEDNTGTGEDEEGEENLARKRARPEVKDESRALFDDVQQRLREEEEGEKKPAGEVAIKEDEKDKEDAALEALEEDEEDKVFQENKEDRVSGLTLCADEEKVKAKENAS